MTEEIKEILDYLKPKYDIVDELGNNYKKIKFKDCKLLLNYITNLQKENENLKEENKRIFSKVNDDELLISNAMNYAELQDYKSRNEKAVEYIKSKKAIINTDYIRIFDLFEIEEQGYTKDLLNILQGGDE